jgi:imidazolonepropionase
LRGITVNAAKALGLQASHGTIESGKAADLAVFDIARPAELAHWIGGNPAVGVMRAGRWSKALCT